MFSSGLLKNKRALITGGGTGLGRGMAERFLELGAEVYICGRRKDVLQQTADELRNRISGALVHAHPCDVRDADSVEELIGLIWKRGSLDILVNNAAGNFLARSEELSLGAFQAVLGIVLTGTVNVTMACARRWLAEAGGAPRTVLNIAATYWHTGSAYVVPSAMAKAGVVAMTRSLAVEWGDRGIRMNAIAPGPVPTEGAFSRMLPFPELEKHAKQKNPLKRFGTVRELADLATFLVCDGSAYINGEVVTMDGGEWLQGAGEFSDLGRLLSEKDWQSIRPAKKKPQKN